MGGGGQRPWVPEGGHSPEVGRAGMLPVGVGFIGSLRQPWLCGGEGRRQGWQSFHVNSRVDRGQDVAMVRLSPEKGHWGARGGGSTGPPCWLTSASPGPPIPPVPLPPPQVDSPLERGGSSGNGCSPSPCQLQLKVKVPNQGWGEVWWVHVGGCSFHLPTPRTPLATRVPFG